MLTNKDLVKKINDAFASGNVQNASPYIDDNIIWNIVGMPLIYGKHNFIKTKEMLELDYNSGKSKNFIAEGDYVVVESSLNLNAGNPVNPSYCEIYLIKEGKIKQLTSYIVDVAEEYSSVADGEKFLGCVAYIKIQLSHFSHKFFTIFV